VVVAQAARAITRAAPGRGIMVRGVAQLTDDWWAGVVTMLDTSLAPKRTPPFAKQQTGSAMNKASTLSAKLEHLDVEKGLTLIQESSQLALYFDVIGDVMCFMHDDGSVNMVENFGRGAITVEAISPENILKVLQHYRPFKEVFKTKVQ